MVQGVVVRWLAGALRLAISGLLWVVARLRAAARRLERDGAKDSGDGSVSDAGARRAPESAAVLTWMRAEVCTRIGGLVGIADLLLEGNLAHTERERVGRLRDGANSLSRTFDDLLELCRIDAGHVVLDAQPFNLREAVEVSLDHVAPMAAERALDLSCEIQGVTPATVLGDVGRLRQILVILLTNACRRTDVGGVTILVWATPLPRGHELHFAVRDWGAPVAASRVLDVFQPLGEIVSSGDGVADAGDLGLALCHALANLMGGAVSLDAGEGRGRRTFELTIAVETPARVLGESRARQVTTFTPRRPGRTRDPHVAGKVPMSHTCCCARDPCCC